MRDSRWSLAGQTFALQLLVLAVVLGAGATLAVLDARRDSDAAARREVTAAAVSLAAAPSTAAALREPSPSAVLQPVTETIRARTGFDFIVVMAPDRTRFTHTNPARIGEKFIGTIEPALAGETFTETYAGSLGPSVRVVTPVRDDGRIVALVSVGVTRARIGGQVRTQLLLILAVTGAALVVATGGSLLLNRRLRRQTHGLAPRELRRLYEHHEAVLHSMHEGLLVFGARRPSAAEGSRGHSAPDDEADVVNDEARRLLGLGDGPVRRGDLPESLRDIGTRPIRNELHVTDDRVLLINQDSVTWEGHPLGTVTTIRDHTELANVSGELESVRGFAEALHAQAHEFGNRLHTVITLVEMGRYTEAVDFATAELELSQALIDRLMTTIAEPALAALLLGKANQAGERDIELTVTPDSALDSLEPLTAHEAVTLVGNLIDNALDAAAQTAGAWVEVTVRQDDSELFVRVADSGPGMSADAFARAAERGYSTKTRHHGLGLALVSRLVARRGGAITTTVAPDSAVTVSLPRRKTS